MRLPTSRAQLLLATALTSLVLPASAVLAETRTITGIEVAAEGFRLIVPTVETEDSDLGEATLRALFAGDFVSTAAELSALDAAAIRIPELSLVFELPAADGATQATTIVYRDIEFRDVVDGVAAAASVGAGEMQGPAGVTLDLGRMATARLDIGALLGFYGLGIRAADGGMRPVYSDFSFDGLRLVTPDVSCEVGGVRLAEYAARPLRTPFLDMLPVLQQLEQQEQAGEAPDPEAVASVLRFYADLFTAFRSSPTEFDGFTCSGRNNDGQPLEIRSGPITIGSFEPGLYPAITVNDVRFEVADQGWMQFGSLTMKAMDFTGAIAALGSAATLDEAWFAANWRKLLPAFDGFAVSGFGIDAPDPQAPGARIAAGIGGFDVTLGDYVNGIPARIGLGGSDIRIALPAGETALAGLGYDRLDLDYDIALHWDEKEGTIVVERFVVSDEALGSVGVSGTLGNATADLFSDDPATAAAASAALTLKDLEIEIADQGMTNLLVALAAREQNQRPVVFRAALSGIAQALPLAALGPSPEAVALGTELRAFVDGKPNLRLTVTARDPAGLGLADLGKAQQDPSVLRGKVTIVAKASDEAGPAVEPDAAAEPTDDAAAAGKLDPLVEGKGEAKRAAM